MITKGWVQEEHHEDDEEEDEEEEDEEGQQEEEEEEEEEEDGRRGNRRRAGIGLLPRPYLVNHPPQGQRQRAVRTLGRIGIASRMTMSTPSCGMTPLIHPVLEFSPGRSLPTAEMSWLAFHQVLNKLRKGVDLLSCNCTLRRCRHQSPQYLQILFQKFEDSD